MTTPHSVLTRHQWRRAASLDLPGLGRAWRAAEGFSARLAVLVTHLVGTMGCAYLFTLLALLGLPQALQPGGEGIVAWVAQTFLQLVLLSVIMVGQQVQSQASDARAEADHEMMTHVVAMLERLTGETTTPSPGSEDTLAP